VLSARSRWWLVTLAAVVGASLTARLGWWQLDRAAQKTALQTALDERARLPSIDGPASLAATIEAAQAQTHRAVRLVGRWRAAHTVFLDNRQMNDRVGFFVVTPLLLADGSAVVVQRGWLPRDFERRDHIAPVPTPDGEVVVEGHIAPPPSRLYEFSGGDSGRIRQNLDLDAYARETGLALRPLSVLLADSPATAGDGLRRDWPAPSAGVAQNQGYAAQWFGLSVLIVVLYVRFQLIPARRRDRR
jgi:surfeit locus 1 family protein